MKKIFYFSIMMLLFLLINSSLFAQQRQKNVIIMVGDGMGLPQIYAAMVYNNNHLALESCTYLGFSKTYSADHFTTDSGAGGTAIACGIKTKNGMIGMNPDSVKVTSILEVFEQNQFSTGIVVACALTHATPASFISHQVNRNMYEEIAADYLKTDIEVFIGGGRQYFEKRKDGRNLLNELKNKNYQLADAMEDVKKIKSGKLAALLYDNHPPYMPERGNMLTEATITAIDILNNNPKGFFLMIEGSQIDWAAHDNNSKQIVKEVLDFDQTIQKVLDYAKKDGNTLVLITADHETGGMTILDGKFGSDSLKVNFSTKNHTGVPVPVFAFGPGAENFTGLMENTWFKTKIEKLMKN